MHRVQIEVKRRILKLTGLDLIQDGKSSILSINVTVQLYLWNSIKYPKINEKHELHYKKIISLWYSDPWKQHVTANKSKTFVSTTLIGLMSNLLQSQTFKNLRKKNNHQDWREGDGGKKKAQSQYVKQTCTFSLVYWRLGMFVSFTTFLKLQLQLQGTNMYIIWYEYMVWLYIDHQHLETA